MKKQLLGIFTIISIGAFAQIPNSGMETWGATYGEPQQPSSYVSENLFASPFISTANPTSVTQIGGGAQHNGNLAAKIKTVKVVSNPAPTLIPDTVGVLMIGAVNLAGNPILRSGAQWTTRSASIEFYYQYFPVNGDNGAVASYLTKWNGLTRDTLATAYFPFTNTINTWTLGSSNYIYSPSFPGTMLPDSIHLYFLSSARPWLQVLPSNPQLGSELWIDDAAAVSLNEVTPLLGSEVVAYPNPATNTINFSSASEKASYVEIYDATGKLVSKQLFDAKKAKLETASLLDGIYLYSVKDADGKVIKTGKVTVSK